MAMLALAAEVAPRLRSPCRTLAELRDELVARRCLHHYHARVWLIAKSDVFVDRPIEEDVSATRADLPPEHPDRAERVDAVDHHLTGLRAV
jgi:hypothetical protein